MTRLLGRYREIFYAAMRIVLGFMYFCHGLQKLFGWFGGVGGHTVPLRSIYGAAGLIELVLGAPIMVGLFTSWAAFVASGEMAAAYFISHLPRGPWPIVNGGEIAVAFCFAFLYIASTGSGKWSLS